MMYGDSVGGFFGWSPGYLFMGDALMVGEDTASTNLISADRWSLDMVQ
ncbi:MAG: hypothetical protein ACI8Z5_002417 [Lentimonas sp.]